jgi:predicted ferric reductase
VQNFAVPLGQLSFYVALLCLGVLTFYKIRRWWYEIFYYVHFTFVPIFILAVLWHATMAWYYLIGGLVLYTADVIIRLTTNVTTDVIMQDVGVVVRSTQNKGNTVGGVVTLAYTVNSRLGLLKLSPDADSDTYREDGRPLCHEMGQYVFINIPEIDLNEWHPFTVSSAPVDGVTTHHIKSMGDTEWTGKLYTMAQEMDSLQKWEKAERLANMRAAIDGPYGVPLRVANYTHLLLVAGGIGVTPLIAVFRQLYLQATNSAKPVNSHLRSVRLVWIMRSPSEIATCLDTVRIE